MIFTIALTIVIYIGSMVYGLGWFQGLLFSVFSALAITLLGFAFFLWLTKHGPPDNYFVHTMVGLLSTCFAVGTLLF